MRCILFILLAIAYSESSGCPRKYPFCHLDHTVCQKLAEKQIFFEGNFKDLNFTELVEGLYDNTTIFRVFFLDETVPKIYSYDGNKYIDGYRKILNDYVEQGFTELTITPTNNTQDGEFYIVEGTYTLLSPNGIDGVIGRYYQKFNAEFINVEHTIYVDQMVPGTTTVPTTTKLTTPKLTTTKLTTKTVPSTITVPATTKPTTMVASTTTMIPTTTINASCSADSSWTLSTNTPSLCFKVLKIANPAATNWHIARQICVDMGGELAPVKNQKDQVAITTALKNVTDAPLSASSFMYFGLWDISATRSEPAKYQWTIDNSIVVNGDYINWFTNQPSRQQYPDGSYEKCVAAQTSDMRWIDFQCDILYSTGVVVACAKLP